MDLDEIEKTADTEIFNDTTSPDCDAARPDEPRASADGPGFSGDHLESRLIEQFTKMLEEKLSTAATLTRLRIAASVELELQQGILKSQESVQRQAQAMQESLDCKLDSFKLLGEKQHVN